MVNRRGHTESDRGCRVSHRQPESEEPVLSIKKIGLTQAGESLLLQGRGRFVETERSVPLFVSAVLAALLAVTARFPPDLFNLACHARYFAF